MAKPPYLNIRMEDYDALNEESLKKLAITLDQFGKQVQNGFNSKLTIKENLDGFWHTAKLVVGASPYSAENYLGKIGKDFNYNSNYYNAPGYHEISVSRNHNVVMLMGDITTGTPAADIVTVLPEVFRPELKVRESGSTLLPAPALNWVMYVETTGEVRVTTATGNKVNNGTISLNTQWLASSKYIPDYPFSKTLTKAFPFNIKNELNNNAAPAGVFVANSYEITNQSKKPAGLGGVSYQHLGNSIQIDYIGGVTVGKAYEVTFLILGA